MEKVQKFLTILTIIFAAISAILYFLSSSTTLALMWLIITILWIIDLSSTIKLENSKQDTK